MTIFTEVVAQDATTPGWVTGSIPCGIEGANCKKEKNRKCCKGYKCKSKFLIFLIIISYAQFLK